MSPQPTPRPHDPLYRREPLPHELWLAVLGVPVHFRANVPEACDAVRDVFGMWRGLDAHPGLIATDELRVSIVVHDGDEETGDEAPVRHRMPDGERVIGHTPGSVGIADTRRGDVVFYVTRALLERSDRFRFGLLEGLTLVIVTARDRLPIHASMIARDGVALLLAGPSGRGKSTLAYLASRSGWTLLADDGVYVQTEPTLRWWGAPRRLYLSADAGTWFPELADERPQRLPSGKRKIAVSHRHDWASSGPPMVERAHLCLLERVTEGPARIERVAADEVAVALQAELALTQDLYGDAPGRVIPRIASAGGWRLALNTRPPDALPLLEELHRTLRAP